MERHRFPLLLQRHFIGLHIQRQRRRHRNRASHIDASLIHHSDRSVHRRRSHRRRGEQRILRLREDLRHGNLHHGGEIAAHRLQNGDLRDQHRGRGALRDVLRIEHVVHDRRGKRAFLHGAAALSARMVHGSDGMHHVLHFDVIDKGRIVLRVGEKRTVRWM